MISVFSYSPLFPDKSIIFNDRIFEEAVTLIANNPVLDEIYEEVSRYFTQDEIANLLMAIVTINAWNRITITTRKVPGTYEPQPINTGI